MAECVYASPAKHAKSFLLIDCVSVSVDRIQRNFEPMRKQVEAWQGRELSDVSAKVTNEAFVQGKLEDSEVMLTVNLYRLCGITSAEKW